MSEKEIILLGAGGHCRSCIDVIEADDTFRIAGIIEHDSSKNNKPVRGYPIIGTDKDLADLRKSFDYAFITLGQIQTSGLREKLYTFLEKLDYIMPVIKSPSAYVSKHAQVGKGSIIMHQACVNTGAVIGDNCILNTKSLIEHDAKVGDHTHISTGAIVNGDAIVGRRSFVGSNATVVNGIVLPDNYFYKAGSVIKDKNDGYFQKRE